MIAEIQVKVSFLRHTLTKKDSGVVEGDYNSTKLVFEFEEKIPEGYKVRFKLSNPNGEAILLEELKDLTKPEVVLAGYDEEGNIYSLFPEAGLYPFELVLYDDDSKLTSAPGWINASKRQVNAGQGGGAEYYLPLLDEALMKLEVLTNPIKPWRQVAKVVVEEDTSEIVISKDVNNESFNLNKIMLTMGLKFTSAPTPFYAVLNNLDFMQLKSGLNFNTTVNRYLNLFAECAGTGVFGHCGVTSVASNLASGGSTVENQTRHGSLISGFDSGIQSVALRCLQGIEKGIPTVETQVDVNKAVDYRIVSKANKKHSKSIWYSEKNIGPWFVDNNIIVGSVVPLTEGITVEVDGNFTKFYSGDVILFTLNHEDGYVHHILGDSIDFMYEIPCEDTDETGVHIEYTKYSYSGYLPYRYTENVGGISENGLKLKFANYRIGSGNNSLDKGKIAIILTGFGGTPSQPSDNTTKIKIDVPFLQLDTIEGELLLRSCNDPSFGLINGFTTYQTILQNDALKYSNLEGKPFNIILRDSFKTGCVVNKDYEVAVEIAGKQVASGVLSSELLHSLQYHPKMDSTYISIGGVDNDGSHTNPWSIDFLGFENQVYGQFLKGCEVTLMGQDV